MSDPMTVESFGGPGMSDEQAKYFAISIFAGVKQYISEHRAEFEEWHAEQEAAK